VLRPLELTDAARTQELFPHWEIVRYLSHFIPWPYPADGARQFYAKIGSIALMRGAEKNRGFWLGLPWHGQGLMSEACEVVTDYWFDVLGFPTLRIPKAVANVPSRRISEKQGMRLVAREEREYVSGRLPAEVWEMTAAEWRAHRRGSQVATLSHIPQ